MTDDELVAGILDVMESSEAHYQELEATVWREAPDREQIDRLRESGDRTTADWYSVVDLCASAMSALQDSGDHWNWPVVEKALDAGQREQMEVFLARRMG